MSSPDKSGPGAARFLRLAALSGLAAGLVLASGCTVRPLYSNAPLSPGSHTSAQAELASIAVKPVTTRYAQQVRNHLIFALNGGAEQTTAPVYSLTLGVTERVESAAVVQVATDQDQPTAGSVILTANYTLTDAKRRYSAIIRADGTVASGGGAGSIHRLGARVQGLDACNGWTFWHFDDGQSLRPIDDLRTIVRNDLAKAD